VDALIEDAGRSTDHDFGRTILLNLSPTRACMRTTFWTISSQGSSPTRKSGTGATLERLRPIGRRTWTCWRTPSSNWPIVLAYPHGPLRGPSARIVDGTSWIASSAMGPSSTRHRAPVNPRTGCPACAGSGCGRVGPPRPHGRGRRGTAATGDRDRYNVIENGTRLGVDGSAGEAGITVLPRGHAPRNEDAPTATPPCAGWAVRPGAA